MVMQDHELQDSIRMIGLSQFPILRKDIRKFQSDVDFA